MIQLAWGLAASPTECDGTENLPCTQNSQLQCSVLSCFLWPPYSPGTAQSLPTAHLPVQMRPHFKVSAHSSRASQRYNTAYSKVVSRSMTSLHPLPTVMNYPQPNDPNITNTFPFSFGGQNSSIHYT